MSSNLEFHTGVPSASREYVHARVVKIGAQDQGIQRDPSAIDGTSGNLTVTSQQLLPGLITTTPDADRTWTLPTAEDLITGLELRRNDQCFEFVLMNLHTDGDDAITLASNTDVTILGNPAVMGQHQTEDAVTSGAGRFRVRRTHASSVTVYRIA